MIKLADLLDCNGAIRMYTDYGSNIFFEGMLTISKIEIVGNIHELKANL